MSAFGRSNGVLLRRLGGGAALRGVRVQGRPWLSRTKRPLRRHRTDMREPADLRCKDAAVAEFKLCDIDRTGL
jgi:hypothetical protein